MINVCFAGITGWTAGAIAPAIASADDLALVSGVARSAAGTVVSGAAVYASVGAALDAVPAEVLVDFTSAEVALDNARVAIESGVHVVIGSSGLTADDFAALDAQSRDRGVGVIAAGNFSVMAAILKRAATMAAGELDQWEVVDYASDAKHDAPSGTARELAEALSAVHRPTVTVPLTDVHGSVEARGAEISGTHVHSLRLPSFVVSTEVVFGGLGERLSLRHDAGESPNPYVAGTLLAIRRVQGVSGVQRGLDSLLFPA